MPNERLLPIKVVVPSKGDYRPPEDNGGSVTIFPGCTDSFRQSLALQIEGVKAHFSAAFNEFGIPAVAKVTLKSEASAKSHRPTLLLNPTTCPIIGGNRLGELYISVEPHGLNALASQVRAGQAQKLEANISALQKIEPYTAEDALGIVRGADLQSSLAHDQSLNLRFRLFRHHSQQINLQIDEAFEKLSRVAQLGDPQVVDYAEGLRVFSLSRLGRGAIDALTRFVGTQSLSLFPHYQVVRTASRILDNITSTNFPAPLAGRAYGLVGMIDSGTDPNNPHLQAWVVDRMESFVPRSQQNNDHGSFVAGLLAQGKKLNHDDDRFPPDGSRIVDVVALDKDGQIEERDLLTVIDNALVTFPQVRVWNLSLGLVGDPCLDHEFSLLAAALDERSKRHGVLFVIAAGNYATRPLRSWPPQAGIDEGDRICPPADALRAITVGSVAHLDTASTRVRREEPSPFTRRGPGPGYLLKPELSHYGGNCDSSGGYLQTGVVSLDSAGHSAENIGTSFACPLVATVAANVFRELDIAPGAASPTLVKALLIHSALIRSVPDNAAGINYLGLGRPLASEEIIHCKQSSATIILQAPIQPRLEFAKRPFPMPTCLVDSEGNFRGEIFMTLLYDPPLDRAFGIEYCRNNVTATLGTVEQGETEGTEVYSREVNPVPKSLTKGYEKDLIQHGFKWSPLKLYHRIFKRGKGPAGKTWRLSLDLLNRSGATVTDKQDVVLIITIRDPAGKALVYDELVRDMARLSWAAQDLQVRSEVRVQGRAS
ncbi:MAG: peptidase and in kexin sedolisin [Verrucomicrobiales bacterium]|nr:peptidase and in kexin sedolisin [Verrucomicrobiales bacterium]